jgi:predicted dienelactone hydrolase
MTLWLMLACSGDPAETDAPATPVDTSSTPEETDLPPTPPPPPPPPFLPELPGPFGWTVVAQDVPGGPPAIPARLFVPDEPPEHAIVLLAGFGLATSLYDGTAEHLASWGWLVVVPDLPGTPFAPRAHADLALDLGRVIDALAPPPGGDAPFPGLDVGRVGVLGHSLGGKVGLLRATDDDRIAVVVAFDPVDAGPPFGGSPAQYPSVTPERMADLTVPIALIGETTNSEGTLFQPACAPADENFDQYWTHATGPALRVEVLGANHMSWLDNPNCGLFCSVCPAGTDDPSQTRTISRGLAVAVFAHVLRGQEGAREHAVTLPDAVAAGLVTVDLKNGF